ncbi:hypothetical protein TNCV_424101 [Trichonephila clavipes]|nr:hypothetical protein TNCV_424101 [Trichonephila clavipes]
MDEILALERRTMGQNCSEWHLERKICLTEWFVDFIPAVKYGLEHEDYIRYIVQQRNPQNVVRQTGLVIHPLEQYIAASPDGLIRSDSQKWTASAGLKARTPRKKPYISEVKPGKDV